MKRKSYNKLTEAQLLRRDNALADFLFNHKGTKNVVSAQEIATYLNEQGYPQKPYTIQMLVNRVAKQKHLPICSLNSRGYYWATNKADIQTTIDGLEKRIAAMTEHIERLKAFMLE